MPNINYGIDELKHYVRRNLWLPACIQQQKAIKNRGKTIPLRYFTFCAAEAIDVFMLEKENILRRSEKSQRLEGVYFCEDDLEAFGKIASLIGSPERGFLGDFKKIVLFEEDQDTAGRNMLDDNFYSEEIREKLRYKDARERLKNAFPFDVINLDIFGVMFPARRGVYTPLLKAVVQILRWQTEAKFSENNKPSNQFTLLLTTHLDPNLTDSDAIDQLRNRLQDNIDSMPEFGRIFEEKFATLDINTFSQSNFAEFYSIAFPKYLIHKALFELGWEIDYGPINLYNRDDIYKPNQVYQMMHSVSVFKRIPGFDVRLDNPSTTAYTNSVMKLINRGVSWIHPNEIPNLAELQQDLVEIKDFRDRFRSK